MPRLPRKVPRRHRRPSPAQGRHPVPSVPCLPRKTTVDVTLCHACHVKRRWMSGSATPATQSGAASQAPKPGPRAPPSSICPTPATQNDGRCQFVPRLPRETTVDVKLCHACRAKCRGVTGAKSRPKGATQSVPSVPCLPRKTTVDVTLCHACHVKRRWMSGCAKPATQSGAASQAPKPGPRAPPSSICPTPATQNDGRCQFVPRLPRETTVDVKCAKVYGDKVCGDKVCVDEVFVDKVCVDNLCGDKVCGDKVCVDEVFVDKVCVDNLCGDKVCGDKLFVEKMSRLPRKVPRRHRRPSPAQGRHPVPSVPCLPRKTTVDVSLCHACHVKRRWMSGCATPATQSAAASQAPNPGPRAPPSAICAMPATQNDGRCDFVPRLPRETTVDVRLCHACHAKCRGVTGAQARPKGATQYHLCHACHAKRR